MKPHGCLGTIVTWFLAGAAVMFTSWLLPGFHVESFWPDALIAAVAIGLVNAIVRPILTVLTLPLTVMTLGLFLFVVNGLSLWFAAWILPGLHVAGFGSAVLGALVLSVTTTVLEKVAFSEPKHE